MAKSAPGKKVKSAVKRPARIGRHSLKMALMNELKAQGGRTDLTVSEAPKAATKTMPSVPPEQRAGYPVKRGKGSVDPAKWITNEGKRVLVDFARSAWLPDDWGQGVKWTNPTSHSTGGHGGTYTVFMAPDGKVFYHRWAAEDYAGQKFTLEDGHNGQIRQAQLQAAQQIQVARVQIKDIGSGSGHIGLDSDETLFRLLSKHERSCLPSKDEFHFCVVSARRAHTAEGIRDIFVVQSQLLDAGVTPTWYVDEASLKDYKGLGLKAVVGGKLTQARNKCLADAKRLGRVCVQLSDDISAWEYRDGKRAPDRTDAALNQAHASAKRILASPAAAARFILAKMRGVQDGPRPHLGGCYMLGSCSRTMAGDEFSRKHFILGDFFVADKSPVRFDEDMKLKEDYDFSCQHIRTHGSVLRCNRLTLSVKHYKNAGGAVATRDGKGQEEKRNIAILFAKWPRAFHLNAKRGNEVLMRWPSDDDAEAKTTVAKPKSKGVAKKATMKVGGKSTVRKIGVKKSVMKKTKVAAWKKPAATAKLEFTGKASSHAYIVARCKKATGKTVAEVLESLRAPKKDGAIRKYYQSDLRYDLERGYLRVKS